MVRCWKNYPRRTIRHPQHVGVAPRLSREGETVAPASELKQHGVTVDAVRRHEIAHCNGWPGTHPKTAPVTTKSDSPTLREAIERLRIASARVGAGGELID